MGKESAIEVLFDKLIDKMTEQVENTANQSFGSLEYHLTLAISARDSKEYLNPLYYVKLPRWLGEYGNTPLEEEILGIAGQIDALVIELNGGIETVRKIREEHNKLKRLR